MDDTGPGHPDNGLSVYLKLTLLDEAPEEFRVFLDGVLELMILPLDVPPDFLHIDGDVLVHIRVLLLLVR